MRVLGIDPGLTRCGWGVVDGRPGARPTALGVGVIRTMAELDLELRLLELHTAVTALLREHRPDVVAIERVFTQNNKGTAMGTAQAAGVAALAAAQADRPVAWHTPSEVKAAISGNGRADKDQVTLMVTRVLGLAEAPKPADAADALALAVCHVWRGPAQQRLRVAALAGGIGAPMPEPRRCRAGRGSCPMIASVNGRVAAVSPDGAVVEVGGIGLAVQCTPGTIARLQVGEQRPAVDQPGRPRGLAHPLRLRRRRRAQPVRAAADRQRRGPRLAQAVLAIHPPREVRRAVSMADLKALMQVPGIGKKGAERLVLELRDRLGSHHLRHLARRPGAAGLPLGHRRSRRGATSSPPPWSGLGWNAREADGAVAQLAPVADEQIAATGARRGRRAAAAGAAAAGLRGVSIAVSARVRPAADAARLASTGARPATRSVVARRPATRSGSSSRRCGRTRWPTSSASPRSPASSPSCSRAPSAAAGRRTTCCCPARPGWARPAWR